MTSDPRGTSDTLRAFVAAVEFLSEVERPGLTVWDAFREALDDWGGVEAAWSGGDPLRSVVEYLLQVLPEAGAPGGLRVADVWDAALAS